MQLAEIILSDTSGADSVRRIKMHRGITFLHVAPPEARLLPFYALQSPLPLIAFEEDGTAVMAEPSAQTRVAFVFRDRGESFVISGDHPDERSYALLQSRVVGKESELIAPRLDLKKLTAPDLSHEAFLDALEALRQRFAQVRDGILSEDRKEGTLASAVSEYNDCIVTMRALGKEAVSSDAIADRVRELERTQEQLKRRARSLAAEQKTDKLLFIKSEYEELLSLRKELKETEQRDGLYGARITELGHDITVHDLTDLTRLRTQVKALDEAVATSEASMASARRALNEAERRRILLRREIDDLERERASLSSSIEAEVSSSESDRDPRTARSAGPAVEEPFPARRHLVMMGGLLLLAIGMLILVDGMPLGWAFVVLGLVASVAALVLPFLKKKPLNRRWLLPKRGRRHRDTRDRLFTVEQALLEKQGDDADLTGEIEQLEKSQAETAVQLEVDSSARARAERDLLMRVRPFAGPSRMDEIDDILETLLRQQHSNEHYDERVSDLLRRIGDLKHGRSDDEMEREYERACHQLYGESSAGEGEESPLMAVNPTTELHFDRERADAVSAERSETESQIAEIRDDIARQKEEFARQENLRLRLDDLKRKAASLRASMMSLNDDLLRYDSAVRFLEPFTAGQKNLRLPSVMHRAVAILGRLTGRQVGSPVPVAEVALPKKGMRVPDMPARRNEEEMRDKMPEDVSLFDDAPPELTYLALRMALADTPSPSSSEGTRDGGPSAGEGALQGTDATAPLLAVPPDTQNAGSVDSPSGGTAPAGGTAPRASLDAAAPLLLLDPAIPGTPMYRDRLFDVLSEWTLETSRQIVYISESGDLADRAAWQHLPVYDIGAEGAGL